MECIARCGRPGASAQNRSSYCDECRLAARTGANKRWRHTHREHATSLRRRHNLRYSYGITPEQYDAMLEAQGGVCFVCGGVNKGGKKLHVDHDHETGRVRRLLCANCNTALGKLGESPDRIRALLRYAEEVCGR